MILCIICFSGEFLSIAGANKSLSEASLVWRDNWVTLLDGLLQLYMLRQPHDGVSLVTHIRNISINIKYHQDVVKKSFVSDYEVLLKAVVLDHSDITMWVSSVMVLYIGWLLISVRYLNIFIIKYRILITSHPILFESKMIVSVN